MFHRSVRGLVLPDVVDFPVPPVLVYPQRDAEPGSADVVATAVSVGVECYAELLPLMGPLVHHIATLPQRFRHDLRRLFLNDFHFVAVVCPGDDSARAAFRLAASVLVNMPLSTVELVVVSTDPSQHDAFVARHAAVIETFQRRFVLFYLWARGGCFGHDVSLAAPRRRLGLFPRLVQEHEVERVLHAVDSSGRGSVGGCPPVP